MMHPRLLGLLCLMLIWPAHAARVDVMIELEGPCLARRCGEQVRGAMVPAVRARHQALRGAWAALADEQDRARAALHEAAPTLEVHRGFQAVFNGFSAGVDRDEIERLRALPGVRAVYRQQTVHLSMDAALAFHRVSQALAEVQVSAKDAGRGIIIGLVDSGVDFRHPGFGDDGFNYPPANRYPPANYPAPGMSTYGNRKVIIGRTFNDLGLQVGNGAFDDNSHGTSTAFCAAGRVLGPETNSELAVLSGVAPGAWIAAYRAFITATASTSQVVAAIEAGVMDGVDVLNLSLGRRGNIDRPERDPIGMAAAAAVQAGVVVVAASGNNRDNVGDPNGTIAPVASVPGVIAVAAVVNRHPGHGVLRIVDSPPPPGLAEVELTVGLSAAPPLERVGPLPLVDVDAVDGGGMGGPDDGTANEPLPPGSLQGAVALVQRGGETFALKAQHVAQAGGIGMLIYNNAAAANPEGLILADAQDASIPVWFMRYSAGLLLKDHLQARPVGNVEALFERIDRIADFSSPGPSVDYAVKPDLTAAGQDVYTAVPGTNPTNRFRYRDGTSFSTPLVAGGAAVLLQRYPHWPPAKVRAALIGGAVHGAVRDMNDVQRLAPMADQGAGLFDLDRAIHAPVLVDPPSIGFGLRSPSGPFVYTETVFLQNADVSTSALTLDAQLEVAPAGVVLSVSPQALVLMSGVAAAVEVTLQADQLPAAGVVEGRLLIQAGERQVQAPLFARLQPVRIEAPWRVLVFDDDDGRSLEQVPLGALAQLGIPALHWNFHAVGHPPAADVLERFDAVLWLTGQTDLDAMPNTTYYRFINQRTRWALQLERYLEQGGALLLSSARFGDGDEYWYETEWVDRVLRRPANLRQKRISPGAVGVVRGVTGNPVTHAVDSIATNLGSWSISLDELATLSTVDANWQPALVDGSNRVVALTSGPDRAPMLWTALPLEGMTQAGAAVVVDGFLRWARHATARRYETLFQLSTQWQQPPRDVYLDTNESGLIEAEDLLPLMGR